MSKIVLPPDMFNLHPGESPMYGEFPDLKCGVEYFKSLMKEGEWEERRHAIAMRFYETLIGQFDDPSGKGKFFDESDLFGWFLFLGEAFTDHPQNYEVVYGCRVVPLLAAIGRNLSILKDIDGFAERAARLVGPEKRQPNAILFEMLVAGAYAREGGKVVFRKELPGGVKTYDIDVEIGGRSWAVECKRMEAGEYAETERSRMRELWEEPSSLLVRSERNTILDVNFNLELSDVPDDYLLRRAVKFDRKPRSSFFWSDAVSSGSIENLDIRPIQEALEKAHWLLPGPQYNKLLTGCYKRYDSMLTVQRVKYTENPHFVDDMDLAVVARWSSLSNEAIEKKARDIIKRLSESNRQLPSNVPGVIHIGFECLGEDIIEQRRYDKIVDTARKFDRHGSQLEWIYCHYFAPEASPEETWAIDETVQWLGVRPNGRPLKTGRVLPSNGKGRAGVHWA
jgi:hypothetical protein